MKDTLIIMGSHPRTRGDFDFSRTDCEIILFNEAARQPWAKRWDYVMQLHIPTIWRNPKNRNDPQHYQWLQETDTPVLMQDKYPDIPASVKFPKDEILSMTPFREVSCSPAWALAWGIYKGYKRIEIYGVELESNTEYAYQQGNFKYWLGVAVGKGITVDLHSAMFDNPLYGYEGEVFIPYTEFTKRFDEIAPLFKELEGVFTAEAVTLWKMVDGLAHGDNKEVIKTVQKTIDMAGRLGEVAGAMGENLRYKNKADAMIQTDGDFVFSRQEFEQAAAVHQKQAAELAKRIGAIAGQLQMVHSNTIQAAKGSPKRHKQLAHYRQLLQQFIQLNNLVGVEKGAGQENYNYMTRLDAGIKAAGGAKSEEAILNA